MERYLEAMNHASQKLDPAAVFGAALSLWEAVWRAAAELPHLNLSECYHGGDEFMRQIMRIATEFESWSCEHVFFEEFSDVWPYLLEDKFGEACLAVLGGPEALLDFNVNNCLRVAWKLRLPMRVSSGLPVAFDAAALNPIPGAIFNSFRIRTVRRSVEADVVKAFTTEDELFDERWGTPYFRIYGIERYSVLEHIADRATFSAAVELAAKLAPGIIFPVHTVALD